MLSPCWIFSTGNSPTAPFNKPQRAALIVLCRLRRSSGFSELCRAGGLNVECKYEDITIVLCVLKAISVFWLVSLMTLKKSNSECCDSLRGWKPSSVTDYRGIYLEIYLEKVHPILRVEMTCVCNSGVVLGLQKSSSRMTV